MRLLTKTNLNWYAYPEFGSYYKLINGILFFSPMLADGSRGDESEVDFELLDGEEITVRLKEIVIDLVSKQ